MRHFFLRAKPSGAWGPVRKWLREKGTESSTEDLLSRGIAIAALGAGWISLLVLGVSQLTVGQYLLSAILCAGALVGGIAFLPLYNKHIARMEESHRSMELFVNGMESSFTEDKQ